MDELIDAIRNWPVLVQGAIGSALFWVILTFSQKILSATSDKIGLMSKKTKKRRLHFQLQKYMILSKKDIIVQSAHLQIVIYGALRFVCIGLAWLAFGLISQSIFPVFGVVGFVGAVYYFITAANAVGPIDTEADANEKVEELQKELKALEEA